jgi:hypothetical protein
MYPYRKCGILMTAILALCGGFAQAQTVAPLLPQSNQMRATKIIGSGVYNNAQERIGTVHELLIDQDSKVLGYLIGAGGFLGVGEKLVALPPGAIKEFAGWSDVSVHKYLTTDLTKADIKSMPAFRYYDLESVVAKK